MASKPKPGVYNFGNIPPIPIGNIDGVGIAFGANSLEIKTDGSVGILKWGLRSPFRSREASRSLSFRTHRLILGVARERERSRA